MSSETTRIINLPRRRPHPANARERLEALLKVASPALHRHVLGWPQTRWMAPADGVECSCAGGCQHLLDVQVEGLMEAILQQRDGRQFGTVKQVGVGGGKTILSLTIPSVVRCERPVLLVPAKLRKKTLKQLPIIQRHWRVHRNLRIVSYEEVSNNEALLAEIDPDIIVCDEAHWLARVGSGRTRRALRFAVDRPQVPWFLMSGTFEGPGPRRASHLAELALREGSYIPRTDGELDSWHQVIGSRGSPESTDWGLLRPLVDAWGKDLARWDSSAIERKRLCQEAYEARKRVTRGVVVSHTLSCDAGIQLRRVKRTTPPEIASAISELESRREIPGSDGVKVTTDEEIARISDTLSLGFYYRWAWEKTSHGKPDQEWMERRKAFSSELADYLAPGGQGERAGVDTPGHVARLSESDPDSLPRALVHALRKWGEVKGRYRVSYLGESVGGGEEVIPVEAVWLTSAVIDWMVSELRKPETLVWYKHRAVAHELRARGARVIMPGTDPPNDGRSCAVGERSHGEGHDLFAFGRMVFPCVSPNGDAVEQQLGRIHRQGQERDEVEAEFWVHTRRLETALARALQDAASMQVRQPTRLAIGTWV